MTYVPPPPPEPLRPLDLAQRKDIGPLLTSAWRVWRARPGVFLLTAMVVAVVPLMAERLVSLFAFEDFRNKLDASIERMSGNPDAGLFSGLTWSDAAWPIAVTMIGGLIVGLFVPALVTATHARAVTALAAGEDLSGGDALRRGLAVFGSAVWALLIVFVCLMVGFVLLVVPGIWLSIASAFTTTIVALSIAKGFGALRESVRIVRANGWWRTLGAMLLIYLVAYVVALVPVAVIGAVIGADGTSDGVKIVGALLEALLQAAFMSWSALAVTLYFFSTKARIGEPWIAPPGSTPIDVPGGGAAASAPQVWVPQQQGWQQQPPPQGWEQPPAGWPQSPPGPPPGPTFRKPGDRGPGA